MAREYKTIQEIAGPLMLVQGVEGVTYNELGEIELANGEKRRCKVLEIDGSNAMVQLFESSAANELLRQVSRLTGDDPLVRTRQGMLLLSAAGFAIYHRIKGERTQRRMAIVLSGLGIGVAVFLIIFTTGFSTNRKPIQFSDSPSGENQIVIMRSTTDFGVLIEAHPSFNGKFFIPMPDTQAVHSNGVIQGVEWDGDWMARVLLCDIYGNDTVIEVDFSLIYDIPESEQSAQ